MKNQRNRIEIDKISKQFKENMVLKDIDLEIGSGEIFGLLGPSGAGKTTLIKILTGQLKQTSGSATIMGRSTEAIDDATYIKLGMVLDDSGLYERLSCYDNLAIIADIYGIQKSRITEVITRVGMLDAWKRPVHKLSKGMKQRLVLARAIMHEPEILFLDEPTSGLDPATAVEIHKMILEQKEKGRTIFLTTHNMEEATKLCDNVALLYQGNIVEYGNPKEVCRKYNHQNKIRILRKTGETVILENGSESAEYISTLFRDNQVESIHSTEPNLENVFMELTGRGLE
ncbi:MAG: ABC transporter ATP-binding protein [Lachnotalea sp.]